MYEVQFRMNDDIRTQKRTHRKMSEAFAIVGGYTQLSFSYFILFLSLNIYYLISTIFSVITFLTNKIYHEVQIVNIININFFPLKELYIYELLFNKSNIFNKSTIIKKKDSLMDEINKLKKKKLVNI